MALIRPTVASTSEWAFTARVVRVDPSGVWVTPLGDDQREQVYGPCRGLVPPAEAIVLLVDTAERPWIVAFEELV